MSEYALAVRRRPARLKGFDGDSARVALVNFSWIAHLEGDAPAAGEDEPGLRRAPAELDLVSGERLAGDLVYVARPGRARVSDILDAARNRFVRFASPGFERFVRRHAILRVRS
jgi:hypothetical protein